MNEPLHIVTVHDGERWLDDHLVEGDYTQTVKDLLMGRPTHRRVLLPGISKAFYRGARSALVMTLGPGVDREQAEEWLSKIRSGREDTN